MSEPSAVTEGAPPQPCSNKVPACRRRSKLAFAP